MKAYSPDLRQRVLTSLEEGATRAATAERFQISLSSVKRYKRSWQTQGTLAPKPIPGRPRIIKESQQEEFRELVSSRTDWILDTLGDAWQERFGVKPTVSVLSDTCRRLKITRKKRAVSPASETPKSAKPSRAK
jgi:transposase